MTSIRGHSRPHQEQLFVSPFATPSVAPFVNSSITSSVAFLVTPFVAFSVAFPDFFLPLKSEISKQPNKPPSPKFPIAVTSIPKYSKDNLQRIFKVVLEAQALAPNPTPTLALVVSEMLREKLKACSLDIYCGKSYMDCYNFC